MRLITPEALRTNGCMDHRRCHGTLFDAASLRTYPHLEIVKGFDKALFPNSRMHWLTISLCRETGSRKDFAGLHSWVNAEPMVAWHTLRKGKA